MYKVKIINPVKKSDVSVRHLHNMTDKFDSVVVLRAKLIESLGDQVPKTVTVDLGYYEGQEHSKMWLCSDSDLEAMYHKFPTGVITLWCDGCLPTTRDECNKRKRDDTCTSSSKRQNKEKEVDMLFQELKEKHGSKFDTPRLRLWARMVVNNLHEDLETPPAILAFCSTPKRVRQ